MNKGLRLKGSLYLAENNGNVPGHTPLPEPVLLRLAVSLGNKLHCPVTNNQSRVFVYMRLLHLCEPDLGVQIVVGVISWNVWH